MAVEKKVIFVPGDPFYINRSANNTFRLNFSCSDTKTVETEIRRLADAIKEMPARQPE